MIGRNRSWPLMNASIFWVCGKVL